MSILSRKLHCDRVTFARKDAVAVSPSFFGQHVHGYPGTYGIPPVSMSTVRSHDFTSTGQSIRWNHLEPTKGNFSWSVMDAWVAAGEARGWDRVYVFGFAPDWAVSGSSDGLSDYGGKTNQAPTSNVDWTDYITAVVNRYKGRIKYWQGWNEPNLPKYFSDGAAGNGSVTRLSELQRLLYQTSKTLDPAGVVLSPSCTSVFSGVTYFTQYLAASDGSSGTGAQWFDVAAYQFYCNDNSRRVYGLCNMHRGVTGALAAAGRGGVAVWATETGLISPSFKSYSESDKVLLLEVYLLSLAVLGVERAIWYGIDDAIIGFSDSPASIASWNALAASIAGRVFGASSIVMDANSTYTVDLGGIRRVVTAIP